MIIDKLYKIIVSRKKEMPKGSYTASLFNNGEDRIIQKFAEESAELVIAAKNKKKNEIISESADVIYHFLTLLVLSGVTINELYHELEKREKS